MKAVVMAGGFGTRIQPLTADLPKPMIPVCNRPMMEYIVRSLKSIGVDEIVVLLYFKPEVIKSYFQDGASLGVKIHYITPDDDYGTAGAVKKAEKYLNDRFIVVSGDLITDIDFNEVVGYHEAKNSMATITLTSVPDPLQFGVVITDKSGKILRFLEKPGWGEVFSDTINTGIYVFEPEVLKYIPEGRNFDFSKDLFPALMSKGVDLYGCSIKGYWRDVGNPNSYRECIKDVACGNVVLNIPGHKEDRAGASLYLGENVIIDDSVQLRGMIVIGDNSTVKSGVVLENCVIGKNSVVDENSRLSDCVIWDNVHINCDCMLNNMVLCNKVNVGRHVEAASGAIIADNTEVGDRVIFDKDVTVWPDKQIESGSILSSNLIWGDKWKSSIFEGGKVVARTNVELSPEMATKLGAAFGSILPVGSKVLVSRDYHSASRMLKRAFLGGLLSTGVNVNDLRRSAIPENRYKLTAFGEVGGVHFSQYFKDPTQMEITFYDENGNIIDSGIEKNLERIFFRDNFRRAAYDEVGCIMEQYHVQEFYRQGLLRLMDLQAIRSSRMRVVADLMNGSSGELVPDLFNKVGVDSIVLNAHEDEVRLCRTSSQIDDLKKQAADITKALRADLGVIIHPTGEALTVITNDGVILKDEECLMVMLLLIDKFAKPDSKVYLPVYAPTVIDDMLKNITVVRGRLNVKGTFLKDFVFTADTNGCYSFPNHMPFCDAIFASLKLMELISKQEKTLSDLADMIPEYEYYHTVVNCPLDLKGYLMRMMSEDAIDKDASFVDGVKIYYRGRSEEGIENAWVHMLPDQYSPNVHLYVEASDKNSADKLHDKYVKLINLWLSGASKE